jgi:hypothetical protein
MIESEGKVGESAKSLRAGTQQSGGFLPEVLRRGAARDYWQGYLDPCCAGCRTGTSDCDVNPLHQPPTQADCALWLMRLGECP